MSEETGGIHWELAEALKLIEQGRVANDWAAERLGWVRLSEALVNAAGAGSAAHIAPILQKAHDERKEDAASTALLVNLLLDQTEIEQGELGRQAARLGLIETAEHEHIPPWLEKSILLHLARAILLIKEQVAALAIVDRDKFEDLEERVEALEEPDKS